MTEDQDREFARHRAAFYQKRRMDKQKAQALYQFGPGGKGIPPNDEPPEPTKMAA